MGKSIFTVALFLFATLAQGQALRQSPFQFQFNQLSLNPAYAARLPYAAFEATYFGNFTSANQVSRSVLVNAHGPTVAGGVGGTLQFYQTFFFGEMNLRPSYAWRFGLANGASLAFGATLGFNYFDIDEAVLTSIQSDFASIDGGVGVFLHRRHSYAGLSVLNLFESAFGYDDNGSTPELERENPTILAAGTLFRLVDDIYLKPAIWLRYINIYSLPSTPFSADAQDFSADLQLSAVVEGTYVVGLLYGRRSSERGSDVERFGVSASVLLGNLRLCYAIQSSTLTNSGVSLPSSHLFSLGFDFHRGEEEPLRFF